MKVGVIADETPFMMEVLHEIRKYNNKVYFIPVRHIFSKKKTLPLASKGLKIYRDNNKYKKLVSKSPQIVFTISLDDELIDQLLFTPALNHPKIIVLLSRTALNDYQHLSKTNKSKLYNITFISYWSSELELTACYNGVGESSVKVLYNLNIRKSNKFLLLGYGKTGSGIAAYLNNNGYYNMAVYDINPVKSAIAQHSGLRTGTLKELAKDADIVFDTTGDHSEHLNTKVLDLFFKKNVTILSSSTKLGIKKSTGYVNKNGTVFYIHESRGMINMSYEIGGNSNKFMRVKGLTLLYLCLKYHKIYDNIDKYVTSYDSDHLDKKDNLYILNDLIERQIAKYILKNNAAFGGPVKQFYSSNYLSESELVSAIVGKVGVHQSLHSPNRMYKIYYNSDGSFTMDTIEDGSKLGTTTGTYKIIKNSNYDIGFIDVTYTNIFESPYSESLFNRTNPNSVFKTMRNLLGPFTLTQKSGEQSVILKYSCNGLISKFITLFPNSS